MTLVDPRAPLVASNFPIGRSSFYGRPNGDHGGRHWLWNQSFFREGSLCSRSEGAPHRAKRFQPITRMRRIRRKTSARPCAEARPPRKEVERSRRERPDHTYGSHAERA